MSLSTSPAITTGSARLIAAMPKAELHLHLDGCLRLETIAALAQQQGLDLPVPAERLAELCVAPEDCQDLMHVLSFFATPLRVLQTAEALERVTYELCDDVRRENVRYVEVRFAPSLHRECGLTRHDVIAAVVRGWQAGRRAYGLSGGVILCGMRQLPAAETWDVARAGLPFLGRGVVGFDLAGDEAGFPILLHREPLLWARAAGYGMTAHAGEAAGPQSVRDAVEVIGVSRVGHGVRAGEDPDLLPLLRDRRIALDMCLTSNRQTRSVPDLAHHPIARYHRDGLRVTINTDNRTVAATDMTRELTLTHQHTGLTLDDLSAITLGAVDAGFAEHAERQALRHEMAGEMRELGIGSVPER